jgi:hypothetical protein
MSSLATRSTAAGAALALTALLTGGCTSDPDPAPLARIRVTPTSGLATSEDGGVASFEVVLTAEPTAAVVVQLFSDAPDEGRPDVDELTFYPGDWSTPRIVKVTGQDDQRIDGDRLYHIMLDPARSDDLRYQGVEVPDVTLNSVDESQARGVMTSPHDDDQVIREGESIDLAVTLATRPTAAVHVSLAVDYPDMHLDTTELDFLASEWNFPHFLKMSADDDHIDGGNNRTGTILATARSADTDYDGATLLAFHVTVIDDDFGGVVATLAGPSAISENGGETTITLSLLTVPRHNVEIPIVSSTPGDVDITPARVTIGAFEDTTRTIVVTGRKNPLASGDREVRIRFGPTISDDGPYDGATTVQPVVLTVLGH